MDIPSLPAPSPSFRSAAQASTPPRAAAHLLAGMDNADPSTRFDLLAVIGARRSRAVPRPAVALLSPLPLPHAPAAPNTRARRAPHRASLRCRPPATAAAAADAPAAKRRRSSPAPPAGKGGYGKVYKAYDKVTSETVAVKVIALTDRERDDLRRIQKEIQFLSDCNHPNIVRYRGSYRQVDALWIVMEYCGGGSVSDLMHATGASCRCKFVFLRYISKRAPSTAPPALRCSFAVALLLLGRARRPCRLLLTA